MYKQLARNFLKNAQEIFNIFQYVLRSTECYCKIYKKFTILYIICNFENLILNLFKIDSNLIF